MTDNADDIPDFLPGSDELEQAAARKLMNDIQGRCEDSTLCRSSIIGALEMVKHALLRSWFDDIDEDGEVEL